jgi:UDP:flavonoid glycosyltransferase YjiC (YdhE family)
MARILFAWEMGANYGHVSAFAPVAKELLDRGHEVIAVLQGIHDARHFLDPRVGVLQAPVVRKPPPKERPVQVTFADLIKPVGYDDPAELIPLIKSWRCTLELLRPDLVLYDAAPTAQLASRGLRFAKVTLGSSFAVPPRTVPLPLLFKNLNVTFPEHEKREGEVVKVVNAALAELGLGHVEALRDILEADVDLIRGYPELDHYGTRSEGEWIGAGYSLDSGVEIEWPPGDGPKIFMYLRPPVRAEVLLKQLAPLGYRMIAVMPKLVGQGYVGQLPTNIRLSKNPARLRSMVASADLAVCHSAVGTGAAFLLAGVPILAIPTQMEQAMIAARVQEQGFGLSVRDTPTTDYREPVKRLLTEPEFREKVRAFADKYRREPQQSSREVCDRLERILAQPQSSSAAAAT